MKTRLISWALASVLGAACAGTEPHVKPDDMSAAEQRQAAAHERELAQQNASLFDARVNCPLYMEQGIK